MNTPYRHSWMWAEACALLSQAEQRQQRFMELLSTPATRPAWEPPADVLVSENEICVIVALPGADADQVVLQVADGQLLIEARVPPPDLGPLSRVLRLEIPYGVMRRRIALPPGHYRLTERRLSRGCLHLRLQEVTA
jgi:HSP20 family molecular chaperone IbpA